MMKILLPVRLLLMVINEEDDLIGLILGCFFLSLVTVVGLTAPYRGVSYLYLDGLRIVLILLSLWITGLMLMVRGNRTDFCGLEHFYSLICILCFGLVWAFIARRFFLFYVFFEFTLVPITLIVLGWGYQPERLQASFYLMLYTVTASLPLLVVIFVLGSLKGHVSFYLLAWGGDIGGGSVVVIFFMILAFLVKAPIFFFHLWLPKAHVESPLVGSMILAGVLLKLGGYGLVRVYYCMPVMGYSRLSYVVRSLALWGGAICGFICLRQVDIKCLIAYRSVTHMGVIIGGVIRGSYLGSYGAVIIIFSHGLVSSRMFLGAFIMYKVLGTRRLYLIKGFIRLAPLVSLI
jgi:NADH-ubiquinone oxidoreductase chain 4